MEPGMERGDPGLRYRMRRALRQIADQHRQLHEIQARLEAAAARADREALRDAFVRYRHAIGAHFELEDRVFFPALHGLHPAEQELEALGRDHAEMLAELQRASPLLEAPGLAAFDAAFAAFRRGFASHERREEALLARLSEER
jgi:hypothetical protein